MDKQIKRFSVACQYFPDGEAEAIMFPSHIGTYVLYSDHIRELEALRADNAMLRDRLIIARGRIESLFELIEHGKETERLIASIGDDHDGYHEGHCPKCDAAIAAQEAGRG